MKKVNDFSPFHWITNETEPIDFDNWTGSRVENFIPKRFTHFAKLMHPLYPDINIKNEALLWSDCDPAEEVTFNFGKRILLKDLAEKYGLPFNKEFSFHSFVNAVGGYPRYLPGPVEDSMDAEMVPEVIKVLNPFTKGMCFFHYDLLKVNEYEEEHGYGHLYYGNLIDVEQLAAKEEIRDYPTYWWPEDKSWCLFTGIDFDFTLFGGTKKMVEAFQANAEIECIKVDMRTRVDDHADRKNFS
ncbi:hypothetical protein [Thalassobacillus hwangdonensis]|uniref:DUF2716 domain-containing protein n=1 Tax=Thalassobacillus hwangdonensis TaxID=546108 RepID=A0ABW3L6W9_9BACI